MKMKLLLVVIICLNISACCQNNQTKEVQVIPLHPYSLSPTDYDKTIPLKKSYVIKFFFIKNVCKATDELSDSIDTFLIKSFLKSDSDFIRYEDYYIDFYRESHDINERFREKVDGIFSDLLEEYKNDLLFRYEWIDNKLVKCEYFKDGKIVKIVTKKEFQ